MRTKRLRQPSFDRRRRLGLAGAPGKAEHRAVLRHIESRHGEEFGCRNNDHSHGPLSSCSTMDLNAATSDDCRTLRATRAIAHLQNRDARCQIFYMPTHTRHGESGGIAERVGISGG